MIFISYSHEDLDKVRHIADAIRFRTDYDLWRDNHIRAGQVFSTEIAQALKDSKAAIVFWSKHSVVSRFVLGEAARAQATRKLIPVRIDDCEVPLEFDSLQTIDLTDFKDSPPYGDPKLSRLISEINRFEKLPRDILTVTLSAGQSDQQQIVSRITGGIHVFVGMNSREAVAGMPFVMGLNLVGFTVHMENEPDGYSGAEIIPMLDELGRADLVILAFFPTLLVSPDFYDFLLGQSAGKPVFVLLFGPVDEDDLAKNYTFVKSILEDRMIRRSGVGFPLEGEPAKKTWEFVRTLLRSVG